MTALSAVNPSRSQPVWPYSRDALAGLRERSYGVAEGTAVGAVPFRTPPVDGDRLAHWDGVEGSETFGAVARRVYDAVDRVLTAEARDAVVVTHGGAATYVIAAWIGMPLDAVGRVKFVTPSGSITDLTEDDGMHSRRVERLGAIDHLT